MSTGTDGQIINNMVTVSNINSYNINSYNNMLSSNIVWYQSINSIGSWTAHWPGFNIMTSELVEEIRSVSIGENPETNAHSDEIFNRELIDCGPNANRWLYV